MKMKKLSAAVLALAIGAVSLTGCGESKEKVLIYTSMEDYRVEFLNQRLTEQFPQYDITVEYVATGNHAAKLMAEGPQTDCDITHDLEVGYMQQLEDAGVLADLKEYDRSIYAEDTLVGKNFLPMERSSGSIILNTELLKEKGLAEPTSYEDLLKPEYKGLISMPSPKASSTGYMFYKSLVNAWGEEKALDYFDKLTPNILQYTSSGNGPLNAVLQGEAAIGLGMTAPSVTQINEGKPIKLVNFAEGAPYALYGQSIIRGKEENPAVKEVFDFMVSTFNPEQCQRFFPEKIYKDKDFTTENYPKDIKYADMSGNTIEEKDRLLEQWKY